MQKIQLCDLKAQYKELRDEIIQTIDNLCQDAAFIKGKYLEDFESVFTSSHKANYGMGCSNGTDALFLSLEALGIGYGDEVIIPSHTFIATAESVLHVRAKPVFCDINLNDYTICANDIEKKITKKTRAIIPVHIYGTPCNMDRVMDVAKNHKVKVIEDCAQAHFAKYNDQFVGTFGDAATYSFYPGKNLGAYGDAGFILCKKLDLLTKIRKLSDHGRLNKYDHDIIGYNHRMDAIQAAILLVKMNYIKKWNIKRREIAKVYDDNFKSMGFKVIEISQNKIPVYHVYNIEVSNRDDLRRYLSEHGISTGIHYPIPIHQTKAFNNMSEGVTLNNTEYVSSRILSLPIYPEMQAEQVEYVINVFKKYAVH